jgi:pantothenate kinase
MRMIAVRVLIVIAAFASMAESFVLSRPSTIFSRMQRALGASSSPVSGGVNCDILPHVDELMLSTYDALASRLIDRYERERNNLRNNQLFVGIAGGPGSGKSTLSAAVAKHVNERMQTAMQGEEEASAAVVVPMDGYHYSRSQLQTMGSNPTSDYTYEDLLARRGAPWTFDAEGCIEAFTLARRTGFASLPVYSRAKSDPVPNGIHLCTETKIVLLEGNYLLAWDDARWAPLHGVFDETWYIACKSLEEQRNRLVKRHLETWSDEKSRIFGEGVLGAGVKADMNDMKNLVWIEETSRKHADYIIEGL